MTNFSIVIATYNQKEEWLNEAIESALKVSDDVIVVNDGGEYLDRFIDYSENFTFIHFSSNSGVAHARNQGIRYAIHDYIICLDSDDILEERIKDIECTTDIVAIGHKHFGEQDNIHLPKENLTLEDFKDYNQMCVSSPFKKSIWEKVGGFDEMLTGYEDWEFWIRCLRAGATISIVKEPLLNYRIHSNGRNKEAIKNHNQLKQIIW